MTPLHTIAVTLAALAFSSCSDDKAEPAANSPALLTFQEPHMGTLFTIRLWAKTDEAEAAKAAAASAFARVAELEMVFSDYEEDSEVVRLALKNPTGEPVKISTELLDVFQKAEALSQETDGAFDVTIGPMIRLWRQARKNSRMPTAERITDARKRSGWERISLDPESQTATLAIERMQIDLGGIAKGYAADAALKLLRDAGFPRSLVAASGDIVVGDPPPEREFWKVGIRSLDVAFDPNGTATDLTGTVPLVNGAISTSGDTQQAVTIDGVRYSHIVDPKTALGLTERIAATVIGPEATTTDSYATAVCILGVEAGIAFIESKPGVECLILKADGQGGTVETRSSGFPEFD